MTEATRSDVSDERQDNIDLVVKTIAKEVKSDDRLIWQLTATGLSAYTQNSVNLAVNAPTGEGKSYSIIKVFNFFPPGDVYTIAGMTEKALFHKPGKLVTKNEESGEHEDLEPQLEEIELEILELEAATSGGVLQQKPDSNIKRKRIRDLKLQRKQLRNKAIKIIDLEHKILLFLDTPKPELLSAIMPLLSHDKHEVEYEYVDTNNGLQTRTNILRGFPAVVFAQALDLSRHPRYSEISRRFIITSPNMAEDKYKESTALTAKKFGLPDLAYQRLVVSDDERRQASDAVLAMKQTILDATKSDKPGSNNVLIPYAGSIRAALPSSKATDMTTSNRFFTYNTLLPVINSEKRPKIKVQKPAGNAAPTANMIGVASSVPIATFEDMAQTMRLMEYASTGLRPYQVDWYSRVFLPAFAAKAVPDSKQKGDHVIPESVIAVTTRELKAATKELTGKDFSTHALLDAYIYPLLNNNIIDQADSQIDKRAHIYYPVVAALQNIKLFDFAGTNKSSKQPKLFVKEISEYPSKQYIISNIEQVMKCYTDDGLKAELFDAEGNLVTAKELVDRVYGNPERFFATADASSESPSGAEPAEQQSDGKNEVFSHKSQVQPEKSSTDGTKHPDKLFEQRKSNNVTNDDSWSRGIVIETATDIANWSPNGWIAHGILQKLLVDSRKFDLLFSAQAIAKAVEAGDLVPVKDRFDTYVLPQEHKGDE